MANKNTAGNTLARNRRFIDRLNTAIDRRDDNGENRENIDSHWNNHTITADGERVWSY